MKKSELRKMIREEIEKLNEDAKIFSSKKDRIGNTIYWMVITDKKWNEDDAGKYQTEKGYSPNPYGFYKFKEEKIGNKYKYTWTSTASSG